MDKNEQQPEDVSAKEEAPEQEVLSAEEVDEIGDDSDLEAMLPQMNVTVPQQPPMELDNLITDEQLMGLYLEIVQNCRDDRKEIDTHIGNFAEMILNEGETSAATKEALTNLINAKSNVNDKMAKVADLMTRVKLKERDTFPKYLAAHQNNTINISSSKRDLIKAIERKQKQIKGKQ
jgi:hypothetical protein